MLGLEDAGKVLCLVVELLLHDEDEDISQITRVVDIVILLNTALIHLNKYCTYIPHQENWQRTISDHPHHWHANS